MTQPLLLTGDSLKVQLILGTAGLVWGKDPAPTASKHELDEEHLGS